MGKIVVFSNQKGGTGKTTLAITLGCGLKDKGLNVCIIDADPQCSIVSWAMRGTESPLENIQPDIEKNDTVLIAKSLQRARERYDLVIVDTGSNMGYAGDNIQKVLLGTLREADLVIIPVGPSALDVDASSDFVDLLTDLWERREQQMPIAHFVVNNVRAGTTLGREIKNTLKESFEIPVLETEVQCREAYKSPLLVGGSVYQSKDIQTIKNADAFVNEVKIILGL